MIVTVAFNKMVIHWPMTAVSADGILTDWNSVQERSSARNVQKGLDDKMTLFYTLAPAIILEPTRLTRWFFRRASPMMLAAK